ncbi:hypothetical protein [Achromobacter sp. NCFB-sbj8-Ac1-l]|jgi:hypothetical protein|uniref:hypothetical protein n=1 Tax=unclassified Achromobacter TaxID=2626865 RepID=UPI0040469782
MKRGVFLFWGGMDALYAIHFVASNVHRGRIPIHADLVEFHQLDHSPAFQTLVFGLSVLLTLSIAASAILFLRGNRYAPRLAYAQVPLRLLLAVPSLSFIPLLLPLSATPSVALNLTLLLGSEALKVLTLYWARGGEKAPAIST